MVILFEIDHVSKIGFGCRLSELLPPQAILCQTADEVKKGLPYYRLGLAAFLPVRPMFLILILDDIIL